VTEDEDVMRDATARLPKHVLPVDPDVSVGRRSRTRVRSRSVGQQVRRTLRSRWDILLVIAAGGALGSLTRWGLAEALPTRRGSFPWATFTENISGGFALGVLMVFVIDVWPPSRYVQGKRGIVTRHDGVHNYPDAEAHGGAKVLDPTYSVQFDARELWGAGAAAGETVNVDLWERYLEEDG